MAGSLSTGLSAHKLPTTSGILHPQGPVVLGRAEAGVAGVETHLKLPLGDLAQKKKKVLLIVLTRGKSYGRLPFLYYQGQYYCLASLQEKSAVTPEASPSTSSCSNTWYANGSIFYCDHHYFPFSLEERDERWKQLHFLLCKSTSAMW